jgi:hypothetical protein
MMRPSTGVALLASCFVLSGTPFRGAVAADDQPKTLSDAMAAASPLLEPVRKAAAVLDKNSAAHKAIADPVHRALDLLKGQSREGFRNPGFQTLWNDAVSLGNYHGLKGIPAFQLEPKTMTAFPIQMGLPVGRGWEFRELRPGKDDQLWGDITRTLPGGRLVREIKIWVYKWTTVYSGVGGENAKELAEGNMEVDRGTMKKVAFRSNRIVTARMGRGFPKTSYYEIVGEDEKLGPVRRRNYYVKGTTTTYNFEVIELRRTEASDDPWTRWQVEGNDPELDAVLEAMEDVGGKKK